MDARCLAARLAAAGVTGASTTTLAAMVASTPGMARLPRRSCDTADPAFRMSISQLLGCRGEATPAWRTPCAGSDVSADRQEVERAVEPLGLEREVRGRDRRREAVVERVGDPGSLVHRIPAERQRQLVQRGACGRGTGRASRRRRTRRGTTRRTRRPGTPAGARGCPTWRGRPARASARSESTRTRRRPACRIRRKCASTAGGSITCSIVCRNTTASYSSGSPNVSTAPHSKLRFERLYLSRACSCASGLPSTPTTRAAERASTSDP